VISCPTACCLSHCPTACICRFTVYYVLNTPPSNWSGGQGFISKAMIQEHLPAAGPSVMVLRCGPGPMNDAMKGHLDALGHEEANQFQF
jgi:cytochrome-b5 reductase